MSPVQDAREFELGVPLAGAIVPEGSWTRTDYPDAGELFDWDRTFSRSAPRVVDLGCGSGRFLLSSAVARPEVDHLGIDVVDRLVREAAGRASRRGLSNVRWATGDAVTWLFDRLGEESVDEIHVYHPQPYYTPRELGRRILTPEFFDRAWRVLRKEGLFVLQTDHAAYWRYLLPAASKYFRLEIPSGPWPDAPEGRTRREILSRRKGLRIRRLSGLRRSGPLPGEIAWVPFDRHRPGKRTRPRV